MQSKQNSDLGTKASLYDNNYYAGRQKINCPYGVTSESYSYSPLLFEADLRVDQDYRAQISFHNRSVNAGTLYFDTDNRLKFANHAGETYILDWKKQ